MERMERKGMNNQDREEALARLLTSMQRDSQSEALAHRSAKREGGSSACLDAESLAAWVDNQLTPAQRSAAETHVASCLRCQSMLAAMSRTAAVADSFARGQERSPSWAFRFAPWMAALGGAVAVALLIVAMQPGIHENAAVPSVVAPDTTAARVEASKEAAPAEQLRELKDAPAAAPADTPAPARSRADSREVPPAFAKDKEARQKAAAETLAKQEKRTAPLARDERDSRTADAAAAAAKPAAPVSPPLQGQAAGAPPQVTQIGERAQESQRFAAAQRAAALDAIVAPIFIQSPDSNVRWRIMGGTVVQHSADAGATWTTQDVKVEAPLVAGSAPAAVVCWLVGRQGTVLVTADGRTWQRVTSPPALDLLGVVATSADSATVTAADGRSFTTSDRGRTWR